MAGQNHAAPPLMVLPARILFLLRMILSGHDSVGLLGLPTKPSQLAHKLAYCRGSQRGFLFSAFLRIPRRLCVNLRLACVFATWRLCVNGPFFRSADILVRFGHPMFIRARKNQRKGAKVQRTQRSKAATKGRRD